MNRQVVTIHPDGRMSGLQVKPGKGLNLQSFGKAKTVRASEIVWDEDHQKWYVDVLQTPGKGVVTVGAFSDAVGIKGRALDAMLDGLAPSGVSYYNGKLWFDSYEDAVKVEIAFLDALRLRGELPRDA